MIVTDEQFLRQVSEPVKPEEIESLSEQLVSVLKSKTGLGLSAIQIGVPKRLFVMQSVSSTVKGPEWQVFANPELISNDPETKHLIEGCLSFPGWEVKTTRWNRITVSRDNLNIPGERDKLILSGLESVIFQHELDHLNGVLFFDRGTILSKGTIKGEQVPGRNDLCSCGSGKKWKKCCGK